MKIIIVIINYIQPYFYAFLSFVAGFFLAAIIFAQIQIKPMYPREAQSKIVQIKGIDYRFAWWRHGTFRRAEIQAALKISASKLRRIAK